MSGFLFFSILPLWASISQKNSTVAKATGFKWIVRLSTATPLITLLTLFHLIIMHFDFSNFALVGFYFTKNIHCSKSNMSQMDSKALDCYTYYSFIFISFNYLYAMHTSSMYINLQACLHFGCRKNGVNRYYAIYNPFVPIHRNLVYISKKLDTVKAAIFQYAQFGNHSNN